MTLLEWKPEYSVGNAAVDQEHQHMIGQINELIDITNDNSCDLLLNL